MALNPVNPYGQGLDNPMVQKYQNIGLPLLAVLETVLTKGKSPGTTALGQQKIFQEAAQNRTAYDQQLEQAKANALQQQVTQQGLDVSTTNQKSAAEKEARKQAFLKVYKETQAPEEKQKILQDFVSTEAPEKGLDYIVEGLKATAKQTQAEKNEEHRLKNEKEKMDKDTNKRFSDFGKELNYLKGRSGAVGAAAVNNQRANRVIRILNKPNVTPQDMELAYTDLASIAKGGVPDILTGEHTRYPSLAADIANKLQYASGKPQYLNQPEIKQKLLENLMEVVSVDNEVIGQHMETVRNSYSDLEGTDPTRFNKMLSGMMPKEEKINTKPDRIERAKQALNDPEATPEEKIQAQKILGGK